MVEGSRSCNVFEISVVIPFFQRERGILTKAVTSALRQKGIPTPRVIIVDDSSPVSPAEDLKDLLNEYPGNLVILRQENQGPGAARNRGILHAKQDSRYIALLDSDDVWSSSHLATAKRALDRGADFYFCDAIRRVGTETLFETKNFPGAECQVVDDDGPVFEPTGDLFERFVVRCPIQTSTVVYRAETIPWLFRTDLRTAAEDHFFWIEVASCKKKVAFSTGRNVRLGHGVNIYNSVEWASPEILWRIFYDQTCMKDAGRHLDITGAHRQVIRARIRERRHEFINNMVSGILAGRRREIALISGRFLVSDPLAILSVPAIIAERSWRWVRRAFAKGRSAASR